MWWICLQNYVTHFSPSGECMKNISVTWNKKRLRTVYTPRVYNWDYVTQLCFLSLQFEACSSRHDWGWNLEHSGAWSYQFSWNFYFWTRNVPWKFAVSSQTAALRSVQVPQQHIPHFLSIDCLLFLMRRLWLWAGVLSHTFCFMVHDLWKSSTFLKVPMKQYFIC